jgi:hypothetical protein
MAPELNARQQDCVEPLLHLAGLIGGQVPEEVRAALVKLFKHDSTQSHFLCLLFDIRLAFLLFRSLTTPTSYLLQFLNGISDSPWGTWHHGGPMTPIDLARILRPFGIGPRAIRKSRLLVYKGYDFEEFKPLWERYLPKVDL